MDLQLKGKRALVTGSSSGIGAAIARELAAEGVSVVVHGRDAAKAAEVAHQIEAKGGRASVALGDLTGDTEATAVANAALAAFGGIDILVNCVGGVVRSDNPKWEDMTSHDWMASFNLNVFSIIRMAQSLAPGMTERGWGRIINISSVGGGRFSGLLHEYGSAKAAVEHVEAICRRHSPQKA
jgi:3-oxoacyl-[acyl-carrier protein] reductase